MSRWAKWRYKRQLRATQKRLSKRAHERAELYSQALNRKPKAIHFPDNWEFSLMYIYAKGNLDPYTHLYLEDFELSTPRVYMQPELDDSKLFCDPMPLPAGWCFVGDDIVLDGGDEGDREDRMDPDAIIL